MAYRTPSRYSKPYRPSGDDSLWMSEAQRKWIVSMYESLRAFLRSSPDDEELVAKVVTALTAVKDLLPAATTDNWAVLEDGRLTKKQASTIISTLKPASESIPVKADPDSIDLRDIPSGKYAVPYGESRLKIQIDVVTTGKWAGWVFVKDAAAYGYGRKYGSQRPGKFYDGDIKTELRMILANPREAMAEYGRLTSHCGLCGLPLENKESIERGIGPVCAEKFGV